MTDEKRGRGRPQGDRTERIQITIDFKTLEKLEARRMEEHRRTIADIARAILEKGLE